MSKRKSRKKRQHVHKKPHAVFDGGRPPADKKRPKTIGLVSGIVLDVLVGAMVLIFVLKLVHYAHDTKFFTDECFHNYIISRTVENGRVPALLPDIYASKLNARGSKNAQPPLFHAMGALYRSILGEKAMPYFNIFLLVVMLASMYTIIRVFVHPNAARLSLLFILSSQFIHQFSVIFYLELLSALTFFLAVSLLFVALEKKRWHFYIYAGLGGMAAITSKISGIIVLPFYFICFVFYGIRYLLKKEDLIAAAGPVITAGVSLAGTMLFFIVATDEPVAFAHKTFVRPVKTLVLPKIVGSRKKGGDSGKSSKRIMKPKEHWTAEKGDLLKGVRKGTDGLLIAALIIASFHVAVSLGKSRTLWIFIFFIYAFLIFLFTPAVADRHFIALIPLAGFLGGFALYDLGTRLDRLIFDARQGRGWRFVKAAGILSLVCAVTLFAFDAAAIKKMPNYRLPLNNTVLPILKPIKFIKENTPDEGTLVFTMWAYSTLYHSGRAATWGANAKGLKDIYFVKDPQELHSRCREAGITHFLIDRTRIWPDDKYNTVVFTETMVKNLIKLIEQGKAEVVWPKNPKPERPATMRFTVIELNFENDDEEKPEG